MILFRIKLLTLFHQNVKTAEGDVSRNFFAARTQGGINVTYCNLLGNEHVLYRFSSA